MGGVIHLEAGSTQICHLLLHTQVLWVTGVGVQRVLVVKLCVQNYVAGIVDAAGVNAQLKV